MPQVNQLGSGGLNKDVSPLLLPPNTFTDVLNVRFRNESVETITGEVFGRTLPVAANFGIHWRRPDQGYNIFARDGFIYRVDSAGNISNMFSSNDSVYSNSDWQATTFNGGFAIIMNNGKTTPLYCLYGSATAQNTFQPLPNWNYLSGLIITAKVVRSLNYSLVAANLTINDNNILTYAPGTIRVSAQSPTGNVPQVWQPGLTADTADEFELSSTSPILDMAELRGNMFVYSEDSISMLTIGAQTNVRPYSKTYGIMNTDCVVEFDGNHFVVDNNDVYVHNGSGKIDPILEGKNKDYFFSNLNKAATNKVHIVKDRYYKEIWIVYPKGISTVCNEALIFNYKNGTWTKRALTNITYSFNGPSNLNNIFQYAKDSVYMTTNTTATLVTNDTYQMYDGSNISNYLSYVEKKKLNTGDIKGSSLISSIYTVFDNVPSNSNINIYVKGQNNYTDNVTFTNDDLFVFEPNNQKAQGYRVDPRVNGRIMNFKIESSGYWRLALYDFDAKASDRR
jgi:hypothetical protein